MNGSRGTARTLWAFRCDCGVEKRIGDAEGAGSKLPMLGSVLI